MSNFGLALTEKKFSIPLEDDNWIKEIKNYDLFEEKIMQIPGAKLEMDEENYWISIDCTINKEHENLIGGKIYEIIKEIGFDLTFKLGVIEIPLEDLKDEYRPGDLIKINTNENDIVWNYSGKGANALYRSLSDNWTIIHYEQIDDVAGVVVQYFGKGEFSQPVFVPWQAVIEVIEENNSDNIIATIENISADNIYIIDGGLYIVEGVSSDNKVVNFHNIILEVYGVHDCSKSYRQSKAYVNSDELEEKVQLYTIKERIDF
jgi:hypothetical protein